MSKIVDQTYVRPKTATRRPKPLEILRARGTVTAWQAEVAAEIGPSIKLHSYTRHLDGISLVVEGDLLNPVRNWTQFRLEVMTDRLSDGACHEHEAVGFFYRVKERLDAFVYMTALEASSLLSLATAGRLTSCSMRFSKPHYGQASLLNVRFSTRPAGDIDD